MKKKLSLDINAEVNKILAHAKTAHEKLHKMLHNQDWIDEARAYAEKQRKELKKFVNSDVGKVKSFIEKQRTELEKFQKQIPGEVKKVQTFVKSQRKELERLLKRARKAKSSGTGASKTKKKSTAPRRKKAAPSEA
jgi:DNA anti-recombination protein RmuC